MKTTLQVLMIFLLFTAAGRAQTGAGPRPSVVLISVDGLRPDYVLQAGQYALKIPNLKRFLSEGAYATGVRGVVPTVTYPSHTTILTGVSPARHGIFANTTFDPLNKNAGGWYWYAADIQAPTLWDAAAAAGYSTGNVHWPVSAGAKVTFNLPQYWRTGTPDDRKLQRLLSTPGLLEEMENQLGPYADGIDETIEGDENRGRFTVWMLNKKKPQFMTAYFTALDHVQHATGPFSKESLATLERIDAIVGEVVKAANAATHGNVVICVVSDHGFVQTDFEVNLLPAFRSSGLVRYNEGDNEHPASWDATLWLAGGSAAVVLREANDAIRDRVQKLLADLQADPANGIDRIIPAGELQEHGGFPGASFLVSLKPGYRFGSRSTGAIVRPVAKSGMHGYWPGLPEMRAAFFIVGQGIRPGSLGEIDMRDIAPTLAGIMRVKLPKAETKSLDLSTTKP
ncbi:MAG TPA: ectonucleotide pyrophosphatase/phosphodiesterase [Candidatus Saccharimonadales bacterium]|jgi:predicted AlkP superfamily pyrophosphatase or phosphodiesterase|nr:ectonucleotide pyrophosphatase/phosphodiesterase [Candidatus Saccharimonadales bacterium]